MVKLKSRIRYKRFLKYAICCVMLKTNKDWSDVMSVDNTKVVANKTLDRIDSDGFCLCAEAKAKLLQLCELADMLNEEFGASNGVTLSVDPSRLHGAIFIDVDEVVFNNGISHEFFKYIRGSDFLCFTKSPSDMVRIQFGVKDLWVKK